MSEVMEDTQAQAVVRDYVCARCWGRLAMRRSHREGVVLMTEVFCAAHPEHEGFVRRSWVERRQAEALAERIEARMNLGKALGLPEEGAAALDDDELLAALGF